MAEVFVNYRTGDGDDVANLIVHYLADRFGAEHVFKASRSIPAGAEYPSSLIAAVRACEILLAVMGPEWPHSAHLREDDDWVRKEILEALAAGKTVIPVLRGRKTDQLRAADLPPELARLAYIQSRRYDTRTSEADLEQIGQTVVDLVPALKAADRSADAQAGQAATANAAEKVSGTVIQGGEVGDVTNITGTNAPTQTGNNNAQFNFLLGRLRAIQPRLGSIELLRKLADRFVPPPGFDVAAAALAEPGLLILDGPPGSGRTAAATMILFASWPQSGRLHELEPQDKADGSSFHLDPAAIEADDRVWVDLSDAEPRLWNEVQRELPTLHDRVVKYRARLVVIQPHGEEPRSDFHDLRRTIGTAPPLRVFHHLLAVEGLLSGESPDLPNYLAGRPPMADIRQLVVDILTAKKELGGTGSLAGWIALAAERASPREEAVKTALGDSPKATQRAALLSTAILHGAHADVIERAATSLLVRLQGESDPALERSPLGDRLRDIGAVTDAEGRVHFTRLGYERAVRSFFWRHFPELHDAIANLVKVVLDSGDLDSELAGAVVRGFTDQCLDRRYQDFWTELVEHLTKGSANLTRMSAAAAILQRGLSHEKSARTFRQQIYRWARENHTPISLAQVLVAACDVVAYTHPDESLVRLHHLARRHPRQVGARDALVALARGDSWLLGILLSRLTRTGSGTAWPVDAYIFLDIADTALFTADWAASRPLITQARVADQLAAGWALAFSRLSRQDWEPAVNDWLLHAAVDDTHRRVLLDVLVNGAAGRGDLLSALFGMAHRAEFRDVIADPLLERISTAQGIRLT